MNWELIKECIDLKAPNQSKGDKAIFYLKKNTNWNGNIEKYDADCVKVKLKHTKRIGDSFFRIICNEKNKQNKNIEKLIIVETKGKGNDYFEQLEQSFDFLTKLGFNGNIHGKFYWKQCSIFSKF